MSTQKKALIFKILSNIIYIFPSQAVLLFHHIILFLKRFIILLLLYVVIAALHSQQRKYLIFTVMIIGYAVQQVNFNTLF